MDGGRRQGAARKKKRKKCQKYYLSECLHIYICNFEYRQIYVFGSVGVVSAGWAGLCGTPLKAKSNISYFITRRAPRQNEISDRVLPDELLGQPQERLLEVVVRLRGDVIVLQVLFAVECDLLRLNLAVLDLHLQHKHTQNTKKG